MTLVLILGACSHAPTPVTAPPTPVFQIDPGTWRAVDGRIVIASERARRAAETYARVAMEEWQGLVRRYTEQVFIPWYSSYWTQQWIAAKVAWYEMQYTEGEPTAEERLVEYLQEEFSVQVLEPTNAHIDPRDVMQESTADYLRELRLGLEPLPSEYQIPVAAFEQHLEAIPAIFIQLTRPQEASLYAVLQAPDLRALPAYQALLGQIAAVNGSGPEAPAPDRMALVARRAVSKLVGTAAVRGGSAVASTVIGGFFGALISAGTAVWSAAEHDLDKPAMEAQLRDNLEAALEMMWQDLVEDRHTGVTAPVHHMSDQIEQAAYHPLPTRLVPESREPAVLF